MRQNLQNYTLKEWMLLYVNYTYVFEGFIFFFRAVLGSEENWEEGAEIPVRPYTASPPPPPPPH